MATHSSTTSSATHSSLPSPLQPQARQQLRARLQKRWAPPPTISISQWAEQNRVLPKGSSARPGEWRSESFQRGMMDAIRSPHVREAVMMTCTQIGKSEVVNNITGYFIDADPRSIMIVQPTDLTAKNYSKKRIRPMIEHCAALRSKVREATSRRAGNTTLLKEFDGGFLKIAGANSSAGLRSDPVALLLLDEVDGYPSDVDGEGDPVEIATRRTDAFPDAKIVKVSTPGKPRGLSRIEYSFDRSDQRRFFVPCPHCGHMQILWWRDPVDGTHRLTWQLDDEGNPIPATVRYLCAACHAPIDEKFKQRMLAAGEWRATFPGRPIVGFHINALYSPWRLVWPDLALEWVNAQGDHEKLRAFINLRLAETFEELGEVVEAHELSARREKIELKENADLPEHVALLVCAADIQQNRIETQILGFGPGEESWLIAYEKFYFEPGAASVPGTAMDHAWADFEEFTLRPWRHPSGVSLTPAITLIDSGSAHADAVYNFVLPRQHARRRVFACKGVDSLTRPGLAQEGTTRRARVRLWLVATFAAKDRIFSRLKVPAPGPGFMHFPDWTPEEYFRQLTAEKKILQRNKKTRTSKHVYVKTYDRNEALDITGYCHAGLFILQQFLAPALYSDLSRTLARIQQGQPAETFTSGPRRTRRLDL